MRQQAPKEKLYELDEAPQDKPCIIYFDSMNNTPEMENIRILRQYVELEFIDKKTTAEQKRYFQDPKYGWKPFDQQTMPLIVPPLPKQKNYTDCGLFLLEYVETFLMQPDFLLKNLKQNKPQAKLFTDEVVKDKRDILKRLAVVLAEGTLANREGNKK